MWNGRRGPAVLCCAALFALMLCASAGASGRVYVSNSTTDELVVVDIDTRAVLEAIPVGPDPERVTVSPDGKRAYVVVQHTASPLDNTVAIVDTESFAVLGHVPVGIYPRRIAVSPDGTRAYVANFGADITVIDTVARTALAPITAIQNFLMDVAVSADGTRLYWTENNSNQSAPAKGAVAVADATGAVLNRIEVFDPGTIALGLGATKAYVTDVKSGGFAVVDLPTDASPTPIAGSAGFEAVNIAVAPNGARLFVADSGLDVVTVRDAATNAVVKTIALQDPGSISVTPDGAHALVVTGPDSSGVTLIETATNDNAGNLPPLGAGGTFLATGPALPPPAPPPPGPLPLVGGEPAVPPPPPPPPPVGPAGSVVASPTRTVRRTLRLRRGCTTAHLRVAGRGVKVTAAKRLAGGRCRLTLRVARTATGRRDLLVKRGRRTVRLRGLIRL